MVDKKVIIARKTDYYKCEDQVFCLSLYMAGRKASILWRNGMIMKDRCIIIAEAGVNHNGKLDLALKLCDAAKKAGADVVKFQTWITEKIITKSVDQADYQKINTGKTESQYDIVYLLYRLPHIWWYSKGNRKTPKRLWSFRVHLS